MTHALDQHQAAAAHAASLVRCTKRRPTSRAHRHSAAADSETQRPSHTQHMQQELHAKARLANVELPAFYSHPAVVQVQEAESLVAKPAAAASKADKARTPEKALASATQPALPLKALKPVHCFKTVEAQACLHDTIMCHVPCRTVAACPPIHTYIHT